MLREKPTKEVIFDEIICVVENLITRYVFRDHYDLLACSYDDLYQPIFKASLAPIIKNLALHPRDVLVDIGGGTGNLAEMIYKQVGKRL